MEEEVGKVLSGSTHVTAVIDEYDSDDLEEGELVPTIELSDHQAEIYDLESQSDAASDVGDDFGEDVSQSGSMEAPIAVPLGSLLSTGGVVNEFNSSRQGFRQRAEFISATVIKPTKRTELGLSMSALVDGGSGLCVSGIKKNSFLEKAGVPLKVGDRVVSINNHSCDRLDHKRAAKLLREAPGCVSIVCQNHGGNPLLVECMISKPSPHHQAGIGFSSSESPASVNISSIFLNGLFADTLLSEGDEVLTINGIPCRELEASAVADIVIASPEYVTVVAKKFEGNGVVVAYDETAKKKKGWLFKREIDTSRRETDTDRGTHNRRRRRRTIGPGCMLLFGTLLITAVIVFILFLLIPDSTM